MLRQWSLDVKSMFPISDDQVLCTTFRDAEIIVDTVTGDIVATFAVSSYKSIACYRNLRLLANTDGCIKLQQLGQSVPRWELSLPRPDFGVMLGCFSPKGQFIVVGSAYSRTCAYVLDVFSGNVRCKLSYCHVLYNFKFISDEEFVILSNNSADGDSLRLFSARSGDILSVLQLYSSDGSLCFFPLAAFPGERLIAICSRYKSDLTVIKVKLSERGNASGKAER